MLLLHTKSGAKAAVSDAGKRRGQRGAKRMIHPTHRLMSGSQRAGALLSIAVGLLAGGLVVGWGFALALLLLGVVILLVIGVLL